MLQNSVKAILMVSIIQIGLLQFSTYAQTSTELKNRFATFLGPNKLARCVWQVEGQKNRKTNFDLGGQSTLMAFDSKDGIKRVLVKPKPGTHYSSASLTWDGKRVLYTDNEKKTINIVDFLDSSTNKVLLTGYEGDGRTWRSPDGRDFVFATEFIGDEVNGSRMYKVNIDKPTEKILVWTCSGATGGTIDQWNCGPRTGWAGATCWAVASSNGRYISGGFPNYGQMAIIDTVTKKISYFKTENGCWPTIARDTTGDVMITPNADDAHRACKIMTKNEVQISRPNFYTGGAMKGNAGVAADNNAWWDALRWTSNRDYCTFWIYYFTRDGQGNITGSDVVNFPGPRLVQISTMKYVALNDNPAFPEGNMDVFFYDAVQTRNPIVAERTALSKTGNLSKMYDLSGRAILSKTQQTKGLNLKVQSGSQKSYVSLELK